MENKGLDSRTMSMVYTQDALSRLDESDDREFYAKGHHVSHLDATALATVEKIIGSLIVEDKPLILDLMAGWDSHIPEDLQPRKVIGLGISENELRRNPTLDERVIHDLNSDPCLPFDDNTFDVVLNTISVQYLTKPFDIFMEVERVLKPGGLFLVTFSSRMFNSKAVKVWAQARSEERIWLVEDFFAVGNFEKPEIFVSEGLPRPEDDQYAGLGLSSDPVFAVYADKPGGDPKREARPVPKLLQGIVVDPEEVERRKRLVGETLRCPYCEQSMTRWDVPDTPFMQWDVDFVYVCLSDACPYTLEGWEVMRKQGNPGYSYRLMYIPDRNVFKPTPVPTVQALKDKVVVERG